MNFDDFSLYANIEANLFGDSVASVGYKVEDENGVEIDNQYSIKGNTLAVVAVVIAIVTFGSINFIPQTSGSPVPA